MWVRAGHARRGAEDIDFERVQELLGLPFLHLTYDSTVELGWQVDRAREWGVKVVVGTGACIPPRAERRGMVGLVVESSVLAVRAAMYRATEIV